MMPKLQLGEPEDMCGECNAHLYIGDNFGDNHATMRCRLTAGHAGPHFERWARGSGGEFAEVTWDPADEQDEIEEAADANRRESPAHEEKP